MLPSLPPNLQPTDNVQQAYAILHALYTHITNVLRQEENDPIRLNILKAQIFSKAMPILQAMPIEGVSVEWVKESVQVFGTLAEQLNNAAAAADGQEHVTVGMPQLITVVRTGRPGRPRKVLNTNYLREALAPHRNISYTKLSQVLAVHRHTLRMQLRSHGICRKFDQMSDNDLDAIIRAYKKLKPRAGLRYVTGFLRSMKLRIQRERIRLSLQRVDGLGQILRRHEGIERRKYSVPRSNALWHIDGHHKLILWGIVIHGMIDGKDHVVPGMRPNTDNKAETVLDTFLKAVAKWGVPYRMRGDHGGENVWVSVWMIMTRGPNRASFMWGPSTRNQRIERLWVEVGKQFARYWRAFFTRLGRLHRLDRKNPVHIWLLHRLFLQELRQDCDLFVQEWNNHPLSGPGNHNMSPLDIRLISQTEDGVYLDADLEDVHPEVLERYYGVDDSESMVSSTDDEDSSSDGDSSSSDVENAIADDVGRNVRHRPIKVADHDNPFSTDEEEAHFFHCLDALNTANYLPDGYMITPAEWSNDNYPDAEDIHVGIRTKDTSIPLPLEVWFPRTLRWVRALDLLSRILDAREQESDEESLSLHSD